MRAVAPGVLCVRRLEGGHRGTFLADIPHSDAAVPTASDQFRRPIPFCFASTAVYSIHNGRVSLRGVHRCLCCLHVPDHELAFKVTSCQPPFNEARCSKRAALDRTLPLILCDELEVRAIQAVHLKLGRCLDSLWGSLEEPAKQESTCHAHRTHTSHYAGTGGGFGQPGMPVSFW